jgi:hypothetical protein
MGPGRIPTPWIYQEAQVFGIQEAWDIGEFVELIQAADDGAMEAYAQMNKDKGR